MRLERSFYTQDAYHLAQNLLGKVLCLKKDNHVEMYRIVETESYGGITDKAAHSYNNRRTKRTEIMYDEGGHLYIYFIYGMYYMLNIVASTKDNPEAVLIRAVKSLNTDKRNINGPGKLCRQLGIDKSFNGIDLVTSNDIYLIDDGYQVKDITKTKRINVDYAEEDKDRLWRFFITDYPFVSVKSKF